MSDYIDRQALLLHLADYQLQESPGWGANGYGNKDAYEAITECVKIVEEQPSAQTALYGYNVEHLAYIARVMQKEGVTAEYAVRTFDDMSRVTKMIIDEIQQKVEEALNERFD